MLAAGERGGRWSACPALSRVGFLSGFSEGGLETRNPDPIRLALSEVLTVLEGLGRLRAVFSGRAES